MPVDLNKVRAVRARVNNSAGAGSTRAPIPIDAVLVDSVGFAKSWKKDRTPQYWVNVYTHNNEYIIQRKWSFFKNKELVEGTSSAWWTSDKNSAVTKFDDLCGVLLLDKDYVVVRHTVEGSSLLRKSHTLFKRVPLEEDKPPPAAVIPERKNQTLENILKRRPIEDWGW